MMYNFYCNSPPTKTSNIPLFCKVRVHASINYDTRLHSTTNTDAFRVAGVVENSSRLRSAYRKASELSLNH